MGDPAWVAAASARHPPAAKAAASSPPPSPCPASPLAPRPPRRRRPLLGGWMREIGSRRLFGWSTKEIRGGFNGDKREARTAAGGCACGWAGLFRLPCCCAGWLFTILLSTGRVLQLIFLPLFFYFLVTLLSFFLEKKFKKTLKRQIIFK